ncbi:DUF2975 domain-containing protein [Mucilaginibacter sabulilitoris]|uniref:DUF2975 domain-containing protein n=1 Tax=Mucilaginibacter sabulilitoris TaxID=1173583 RepID=A0ABZ0TJG9_9SPHI|nr:DUF2975 domain-containing protein [Mucilaginibacter sabulilitoris]WPU92333.1 DUF2975 domain-containing protein [Mucilaginibacter sabulilitoris]
MKIKISTNMLVNGLIISVVIFYSVMIITSLYFTSVNTIYHTDNVPGDTYTWSKQLPEIDPEVPASLPYFKYLELKQKVKLTRQLRNGEFLDLGGAQMGGVMRMGGGMLCDTCSINHDKLDIPGVKQYYIKLPGWKLKKSTFVQFDLDSVKFYVEHKQSYVRKAVIDKVLLNKNGTKNYLVHEADVPVKFRYDSRENCIMIPISKTARDIINPVMLIIVIIIALYFLYLIAAFLNFIIDVSKGLSFTKKNINRLRLIALSLLGFPVLAFLLNMLMPVIFHSYFTEDAVFNIQSLNNDWISMGIGIVFLLLFRAFKQGKILKDEQDLTV